MKKYSSFTSFTCCVLLASSVSAAVITQDFGTTTGNTTAPTGWSFVDASGNAANAYETVTGDASVAGQITAKQGTNQVTYPAAYIVSDTAFDATANFSGTFDFLVTNVGDTNNGAKGQFLMGSLADGVATSSPTAGEYAGAYLARNSFGNKTYLQDGTGTALTASQDLADGSWYSASFSWTHTSGTTGTFQFETTSGPDIWDISSTYTFTSNEVYFGFGTAGYWGQSGVFTVDNISITGTEVVPEPSSFALIAGFLALTSIMLRRRR